MPASPAVRPGDEIVPDANLVFDHAAVLHASPEQVWPWVVQLGKRRAGWYLPSGLERLLPTRRRALRTIDAKWQALAVGDRIPDYGGREDWLEVSQIQSPHTLIYRTERRGAPFTWALLLTQIGPDRTELRLRFRGRIASTGLRRRAILTVGRSFDWLTGWLMVKGLAERV